MADAPAHHLLVLLETRWAAPHLELDFVKTMQCTLMPRLPPIDVDSEQADLPEVLVAIQWLDRIHQMLIDVECLASQVERTKMDEADHSLGLSRNTGTMFKV